MRRDRLCVVNRFVRFESLWECEFVSDLVMRQDEIGWLRGRHDVGPFRTAAASLYAAAVGKQSCSPGDKGTTEKDRAGQTVAKHAATRNHVVESTENFP